IMINRKHKAVHRLAYETWVGPIPDGHIVRHRCDNPPCINPIHLETGTWGDNMKDKVERGRLVVPLGSSNGQAKLTEAKVLEMRSLYASGEYTYRDLADLYGVSIS